MMMARNFSSAFFLALLVLGAFVAAQDRDDDDKVPPSNTTASGSASSPPGPAVNPQALACFQDCSKDPISKSPCAKQITPSNPIPPASCLCNDADFLRGASGCVTNKCLNFVQDVMTEVESFCGPDAFKAMQIIGGSTGAAPNSTPSGNATDAGSDSKGPKIPQDALDCFQGCSTLPIANSTCTQKIVNNATSPSACLCHDAQFLQATSGCAQNQCLKHAAFFERELQRFCGPDTPAAMQILGGSVNGTTNGTKPASPPKNSSGAASAFVAAPVPQIVLAVFASGLGIVLIF